MEGPLLTYILPSYNCSGLVIPCLDSIYATGLDESEFEVVITDDASTDNTLEVLEGYASCHSNMTVLRQERNHRQGAARNRGLQVARGRYITFVDSDDRVTPDMALALREAIANDVDIFCGVSLSNSLDHQGEFRPFKIESNLPHDSIFTGEEFCKAIRNFSGNNGTPWGYLFKTEMVRQHGRFFIEDHFFEETDWIAFHFLKARSVYYSARTIYLYLIWPDSVSNRNMGIDYVVDSNKLSCRLMRLVEDFRTSDPAFVRDWNASIDQNLLSRGVRWRFLVQYKPKDIRQYFRDLGKEDLAYLAQNYHGKKSRRFFFRHRRLSTLFFTLICSANALQRKVRGMGPARTNFYS